MMSQKNPNSFFKEFKPLQFIGDIEPLGEHHVHQVLDDSEWMVGVYPVLYGFRIRWWKNSELVVAGDICCGNCVASLNLVGSAMAGWLAMGGSPVVPRQEKRPLNHPSQFKTWLVNSLAVKDFRHPDWVAITPHDIIRYKIFTMVSLNELINKEK